VILNIIIRDIPSGQSSRQFDIAVDFDFEVDAADRNDSPSRQCRAGQFGVANRLLNLSLGSNTEPLEEPVYVRRR
jgi:hypothetical protein